MVIAREVEDRRGGATLGNLGIAYKDQGEAHRAVDYYEQALVIAGELGDQEGLARQAGILGLVLETQGTLARAASLMQVLVDYEQAVGHPAADGGVGPAWRVSCSACVGVAGGSASDG